MIVQNGEFYPDVFLAGAPKSGTTFLFHPLAKHSSICASNPKEPDFYLDDDNPNKKSEKRLLKKPYTNHFDSLDEGLLHLDGSQWTIYQLQLIEKISHFEKKPKVLFILREPARRILSSFQYTSNNISAVGDMSFSQYVDYLLNSDYQRIENGCKSIESAYSLQNELKFSDYSFYLDRWKEAVGEENMQIFLFEDMKTNTARCYARVCDFLGIDQEEMQVDAEQMNKSVEIKSKFVHYFLHKAFALTGFRVPFKKQMKQVYARLQHKDDAEKENYSVDLARLKAHYKPLNEKLALAYQLDLTGWK